MGGSVSKEESLSNLRKEDLSLPDIAIEFPSPTSGSKQIKNTNSTLHLANKITSFKGLSDLPGLLSLGVPLMKAMIDMTLDKLKILVADKKQDALLNKRLFAEEKVTELRDLMDLYYDYVRRYGNNLSKMIEETKVFQGKFSEQLKRVKNALTDGHISSPSFKIWVNGAAFHVEMLIRLAQLKSGEDSHSVRQAILVYQDDLQQMINSYRKFREDAIDMSGGSFKDPEQGKCIEYVSLDKYEVTKYLFEVDKQIPELEQHFTGLLERVDHLVTTDSSHSNARVIEVADERMIASGSEPRNLSIQDKGVTVVEHRDAIPSEDDHHNLLLNVDKLSTSSNRTLVDIPTSGIGNNSQQWIEAMKIQSLLMKFSGTQVRQDFLNGMFNIPVHTSRLLQEIDHLNSCLFPFLSNHSDTGLTQTAATMLLALAQEKPEPLILGDFMTDRTCKSWAQILRIIANSDYWNTVDDAFTGHRNSAQETGRPFSFQSAPPSQNREHSSFGYPEYHQNQDSADRNDISNTRTFYNSQRRNPRSSAPSEFSQSRQDPEAGKRKQRRDDKRRGDDLCMFCGKPGHRVEKCRLNVKCRTCSQWGHSSKSCPENRIVFKCPICQEDHLGKDCPRFSGKLSFE